MRTSARTCGGLGSAAGSRVDAAGMKRSARGHARDDRLDASGGRNREVGAILLDGSGVRAQRHAVDRDDVEARSVQMEIVEAVRGRVQDAPELLLPRLHEERAARTAAVDRRVFGRDVERILTHRGRGRRLCGRHVRRDASCARRANDAERIVVGLRDDVAQHDHAFRQTRGRGGERPAVPSTTRAPDMPFETCQSASPCECE